MREPWEGPEGIGREIEDAARIKAAEASHPAYTYTCDAGGCDATTVAVIDCEDGWISMCVRHAQQEINKQWGDLLHTLFLNPPERGHGLG